MDVNMNLTSKNYTYGRKSIQYIVIHYTGGNGDTAKGNTEYFKNVDRGASAHYFVDETSVWQCVLDTNTAWHCGSPTGMYYSNCRNNNSIGVEMCSIKTNGVYSIPEKTIDNTIELVKKLMHRYGVPVSNIIRHYDVTHKNCPEPFVRDWNKWAEFKNRLGAQTVVEEPKHWCDDMRDILLKLGVITNKVEWSNYDSFVSKGLLLAILDKASGGTWTSDETNYNDHWAQPNLISIAGKGGIKDISQWTDFDTIVSKALTLALVDKLSVNSDGEKGIEKRYKYNSYPVCHLNSLCDKRIITTPNEWVGHFEDALTKAECIALVYKFIMH